MRKVPKKNYIIAGVIVVVTVFLTFYVSAWYTTVKDYKNNNSILSDILTEVDANSITDYLMDNSNVLVYVASPSDINLKTFEKKLKKIIINNDLASQMVYFDSSNVSKQELEKLLLINKNINLKESIVPNIYYYENNELVGFLYHSNNNSINKEDVVRFLENMEIISND